MIIHIDRDPSIRHVITFAFQLRFQQFEWQIFFGIQDHFLIEAILKSNPMVVIVCRVGSAN
jgi:hypothetical protein